MTADAPATIPTDSPVDRELDELAAVIERHANALDLDDSPVLDGVDARSIAAAVLRHQATRPTGFDLIPNWYIVFSSLLLDLDTPAPVRDAIREAVDYVMTLRTQRARILRLFDEATAAGMAVSAEAAQHRDALATLLLAADDSLTPTVDVQEVAAMRQALVEARDVVNVADDHDVVGSGDPAMIRLAHALAAVNA